MKFFKIFLCLLILSYFCTAPSAWAVDFNVSTAAELQSALDSAAGNGSDDTIIIGSVTIETDDNMGGSTFTFSSSENHSLSIIGAGPDSTILDGNSARQILNLDNTGGTGANISIEGIRFQNGDGMGTSGGGVSATSDDGSIELIDNSFFQNHNTGGNYGGAYVYSTNGDVSGLGNYFEGNTAGGDGGGLVIRTGLGDARCEDNFFIDNDATNYFGGVDCRSSAGSTVFRNNFLDHNRALNFWNGGAIVIGSTEVIVENNIILRNESAVQIGGIQVQATNGDLSFINNLIAYNQDGINSSGISGGAFVEISKSGYFINNTIYNNVSPGRNGGLSVYFMDAGADAQIYNNILFDNQSTMTETDLYVANTGGEVFNLFNNDFSGFCSETPATCDPLALGPNQGANIDADPQFVNAALDDFNLMDGSPAINTGTRMAPMLPATDLAGNPRVVGPEPDMGALETLTGIGVDPLMIDFGMPAVGVVETRVITITSLGPNILTVTGISLSDLENFSLNLNGGSSPCGSESFNLNPGSLCTIEVAFNPTASGNFNAVVTISSDDPNQTSVQVTLVGVGSNNAVVQISGGGCSLGGTPFTNQWWLGIMVLGALLAKRWLHSCKKS